MRILYYVTMPPSPMAECDAVVQDVRLLQRHAPGNLVHLYPARTPGTRFPRALWGLSQLLAIRRAEKGIDVHHFFNPDPYPFAILRFLRRPVVYTVLTSVHDQHQQASRQVAGLVSSLVVPTPQDESALHAWGIHNTTSVRAGVDAGRFTFSPVAPGTAFTLLCGSAPWSMDQFDTKGIEALLQAAQRRPDLRLVFLWRGVLYDEMIRRVKAYGLQPRVRVLNEKVDVNAILAGVHAGVVLASDPGVVKSYPHSLLESIAAGKPVLVSRSIALASEVEQWNWGQVVDSVDVEGVLGSLERLEKNYAQHQRATLLRRSLDGIPFSEAYVRLYQQAMRA